MYLTAGWNEQNHVTAWLDASGNLLVKDTGAPLTATNPWAGPEPCTQVSVHTVNCGTTHISLFATLNNLDDFLNFAISDPAFSLGARGMGGLDTVYGAASRLIVRVCDWGRQWHAPTRNPGAGLGDPLMEGLADEVRRGYKQDMKVLELHFSLAAD